MKTERQLDSAADSEKPATRSLVERASSVLLDLVSEIPVSGERSSATPDQRARTLATRASARAAIVSGSLSLPSGPIGMLTVLPDIVAIWKIQRQMVADLAAVYGKTPYLGPEVMIYCLFRHAASHVVRVLVVRLGERMLVRQASMEMIRKILRRVSINVTERVAGRAIARWAPLVGAVGVGAYAFYDTAQVAKTTMTLFQKAFREETEPLNPALIGEGAPPRVPLVEEGERLVRLQIGEVGDDSLAEALLHEGDGLARQQTGKAGDQLRPAADLDEGEGAASEKKT